MKKLVAFNFVYCILKNGIWPINGYVKLKKGEFVGIDQIYGKEI